MVDQPAHRAAVVEFDHVTKHYDASESEEGRPTPGAVNDLSLTVPAGKICVLVGPSGCGKTTSLKMVNRLIEPTSGPDPDRRRGRRRPATLTELRREHRLRHPAGRAVPAPDDRRQRGDRAAPARLAEGAPAGAGGGAPRARRPRAGEVPRPLSRASCPAASGSASASPGRSPRTRRSCSWTSRSGPSTRSSATGSRTSSCASRSELAKTILFVTHDIDEAIKMGDLVAVFQAGGVLAQFGSPLEILAAPASEFVARFVGAGPRAQATVAAARVATSTCDRPATARPGDDAADARRRALDDPLALPPGHRRREPAARLGRRRRHPGGRPARRVHGQPDLAVAQQADDAQGRPVDDARRRRPDGDRRRPDGRGPGAADRRPRSPT